MNILVLTSIVLSSSSKTAVVTRCLTAVDMLCCPCGCLCLYLAIGEDIKAEITPRADKRYSYQVYFQMFMGASRLEETKVVQIICDPAHTF